MPAQAKHLRHYSAMLALSLSLCGCGSAEQPERHKAMEVAPRPSMPQVHFVQGYEAGVAEARRQRRPVLIVFTAQWCEYCQQMLEESFRDPAVVSISDQFVCVMVDADRESLICSEFRVRAYPTVQFLSPRGVPLNRTTGMQPGQTLYLEMQAALQAVARRNAAEQTSRL